MPIERVFLDPPVTALPQVRKALKRADKILIGPGDLYTSVVPCLLVDGVAEAIRACDGEVVYVCNVMTKRGETDGYARRRLRPRDPSLPRPRVDTVVVNTAMPLAELAARYAARGRRPVDPDLTAVRALVPRVLAARSRSPIR